MRKNLPLLMLPLFWINVLCAADVIVITLEGEEQTGSVIALSEEQLSLDKKPISLKNVSEIRFAAATSSAPRDATLHLRNGDTILNAGIVSGDDTKLKFKSEPLGELVLENKFLDAISFNHKDRPSQETIDGFLRGPAPKEDLLLLPKGDTLSGFFEKITEKEIVFNAGGQSRAYPFETLAAFRLAPLEEYKPRAIFLATVVLRDNSVVTGKLLGLADSSLSFEAINGAQWSVTSEHLAAIRFKGGKLVYLSDLAPASVEQKPYVGGLPVVYQWRRDRAVSGEKIILAGVEYRRGISMHSYCRLTYNLDGQYARFLADVGVDGAVSTQSICEWKVLLDGKQARSGVAHAGAKPESLKIDVAGVKQLELICDYGPDQSDAGDHLNWANARLIRQ